MNMKIDTQALIDRSRTILLTKAHKTLSEASAVQLHEVLSSAVMEIITPLWMEREETRKASKQAYYFSAEYLVGRMVFNNLFCLGILDEVRAKLSACGVDLAVLEDIEDDAFGNGGLGRLAACFLDSAVTHDIPLTGYGLRYRNGLFRQSFQDGRQREEPDDWSKYGDPWSIRRDDLSIVIPMKTGDVLAVPYDMPVVGHRGRNIGTLRLWQAESLLDTDFDLFNQQKYAKAAARQTYAEDITRFLYPNDTARAGKLLRIKQQYLLVSASLQDLLRQFKAQHGTSFELFPSFHAIQLNDTHPVMAIPELIRLLRLEGLSFEEAFVISREVFAYTNHTVMQEALEKWDISLLNAVVPELVEIIRLIDERFIEEMRALPQNAGKKHRDLVKDSLCILRNGKVHMAQLAVYATHATNGVAAIHSDILKKKLFADWYALYPERFQNKTNGITQRRWLGLCNPELCSLLTEELGTDAYLDDLYLLSRLRSRIDADASSSNTLARSFIAVKHEKKRQLSDAIRRETGIDLPPEMIFDVQIKRLHEYKRQFMNALSLLALHEQLKAGLLPDWHPTAYVFGAKAAPGYARAKAVIHLINLIAEKLNSDPETNSLLRVVFIPNYNCSWAEKIIPAADISEQISPVGTEASGTGNMKLMLNGAVTLGTYDGANIEIVQEAGKENNFIFGGTVEEFAQIQRTYDPKTVYQNDPLIHKVLDMLTDGTFPDEDGAFAELRSSILDGASWHKPDHYFVLYDFPSYLRAKIAANREYKDSISFARKCLYNIAGAGKFSSDRTVVEYAKDIWKL